MAENGRPPSLFWGRRHWAAASARWGHAVRQTLGALCALALLATESEATPLDPDEARIVRLSGYEFDTRQGDPELPGVLRASQGDVWLVQLMAPIREQVKEGLRRVGVELYDYVPNNAFICRVPAGREEIVLKTGAAVWVGRYHPAYKISTRLLGVSGRLEVRVLGFPWASGPELVAALREVGMDVADWAADPLNVTVRGVIEAQSITRVAGLQHVYYLEEWIRPTLQNHQAQWVMQTNAYPNRRLWDVGLKGQGQVLSTSDSGILTTHDMFRDPDVPIADWGDYPTHRKIVAYIQGNANATFGDGPSPYWHGTYTGGSACGDDSYVGGTQPYDGMALLCRNYFVDLGDSTGGFYGPTSMWWMFNQGYFGNEGGRAFIHSMSWISGTDGAYTGSDRAADNWMWYHRDGALFVSAGNDAAVCTGSPGNAKSIVTVGACKNGYGSSLYCTWCSHGPTQDGRIKPDILAPGEFVWSSEGPGNATYHAGGGTSISCPILASTAAQVRQYFTDGWYPTGTPVPGNAVHPSGALLKAVVLNGGDEQFSGYTVPSNYIGWGRTCLDSVLYLAGDARGLGVVDDTTGVQTGHVRSHQYDVQAGDKLEVTLAWTDYRASVGANPCIVNDLDLEVQAPNGCIYKGNVYAAGQSQVGGSYDRLNTVEGVHLYDAPAGTYTVRVTAYDVPVGPQPYALVVTGGLDNAAPGRIADLTVEAVGADLVLAWSDPGDNVGVVDYRVYRSPQAHFSPTGIPVATVPAPAVTWTDVGIVGEPGLNFFYVVRARDAAGNEGASSNCVGEFDYGTTPGLTTGTAFAPETTGDHGVP
jgi:hypothetical protein